jgi:hypothetical protein
MESTKLFIEVVRASHDLPMEVRSLANEARGVEESSFDDSYIQFLDEQIRLEARGPKWTAILRRRRKGLSSFCGVLLVSGHIRSGRFDTWIKIDPKNGVVVYWEQLGCDPSHEP